MPRSSEPLALLNEARARGAAWRIGVDEVGRGPLAGPVVAAAVALPAAIPGVADSKALSPKRRDAAARAIREQALFALGAASAREIEGLDIRRATFLAMRRAVARFEGAIAEIVVDGRDAPDLGAPVRAVIGGDAKIADIAAASILAKTVRDRAMVRLARRYPAFGFERNAGYGVAQHKAALAAHGPTPHHRRTFAPIRALLAG